MSKALSTSRTLSRRGVIAGPRFVAPLVYPTLPEAEYIMSTVGPGGVLEETPGDTNVRPYMSHYGALGLVRAFEVTLNPAYLNAAWAWAGWYRDHMNSSTGYVNDYTGHGSTDSGAADSTDAYAGMYLTLLWSLYTADQAGDSKIGAFAASIPLALTAIESTQQIDGLTYALPTYDVKYLEDNVEALYGARCAQQLAFLTAVYGDAPGTDESGKALYLRAVHTGNELARGVGILWDYETGVWDYAIHSNGVYARNDWTDENAQRQQIWATGWGEVVTPLTGVEVLSAYVAAFPTWATESAGGAYEVMPLWAYRRAGDVSSATSNAGLIEDNAVANTRTYPFTVQTAGLLLIGQYGFTQGMNGLGGDGDTFPKVLFPDGTNFLANAAFPDTNHDGLPDGLSNYGGPTNSVLALTSGDNAYEMVVPYPNGYDMHWDATYDLSAEVGVWYCFSIYKQFIQRHSSDGSSRLVLKWEAHDSGDSFITYGYNLYPNLNIDGKFERIWISFLVPSGGTPWAKLHLAISIENGGTVILAEPKFEKAGASPTPVVGGVPVLVTPAIPIVEMPFVDHFTRADGPLTSPWRTYFPAGGLSNAWAVTGNQAQYVGTSNNGYSLLTTTGPDHVVSVTVAVLPGVGGDILLNARMTDFTTRYLLRLENDPTHGTSLALAALNSGTTFLWTQAYPGAGNSTISAGDVIALSVSGPVISVLVNGTVLFSTTDSSVPSANNVGLLGGTAATLTATRLDDFSITLPTVAFITGATRESDNFGVNDGWLLTIPTGSWKVGVRYTTPDTVVHDFAGITASGPLNAASESGYSEVGAGSSGVMYSIWISPTSNYADKVFEHVF